MPAPDMLNLKNIEHCSPELMDCYLLHLGRFLHQFAQTENDLLFLLDRYATGIIAESYQTHIPPTKFVGRTDKLVKVVRGIIGSQRSSQISESIKLLMRLAPASREDLDSMSDALAQFGQIRSIRDRLMHTGALPVYEGEEWWFRTWTHNEARERHKAHTIKFQIKHLEAMESDLSAIRLRASAALVTEHLGPKILAERHGAFAPWRYKHIQPEIEGRKTRKKD